MVIDMHGHLHDREHWPEGFWTGMSRSRRQTQYRGCCGPIPEVKSEETDELLVNWEGLGDPDQLVRHMDAAGVDKMAMLAIDLEAGLGIAVKDIVRQNIDYADLQKRHPDRFVAFAGVDPQRGEYAYQLFERMLREHHVKGLKLHATTGFSASDRICYPLYELAREWGVPVAVHSGMEFPPLRSEAGLNAAFTVDAAASDFPEVNFVLVHMGTGSMMPLKTPWIEPALWMASNHRNVFVDLSSKQRSCKEDPVQFYRGLREVMDGQPVSRILFGSDAPYHELSIPLADWVNVFRKPDPVVLEQAGVSFAEADMEAILWRNAREELGF